MYSSIRCFENALKVDDGCALAHAGLADVNVILGIWGLRPPDVAFGAGRRAANGRSNWTRISRRRTPPWRRWSRVTSGTGVKRNGIISALSSSGPTTRRRTSGMRNFWSVCGAIRKPRPTSSTRGVPILCLPPSIHFCPTSIWRRDYGRAVHEGQRATSLEPYAPVAHFYLGRAYLFSNRAERAVETLGACRPLGGEAAIWKGALSYARARAGDHAGASRILLELIERARHEYVSPYDLAIAFTGIGDSEWALDHLEQAFSHASCESSCSAIQSLIACVRSHDTGACSIASACQALRCENAARPSRRHQSLSLPAFTKTAPHFLVPRWKRRISSATVLPAFIAAAVSNAEDAGSDPPTRSLLTV